MVYVISLSSTDNPFGEIMVSISYSIILGGGGGGIYCVNYKLFGKTYVCANIKILKQKTIKHASCFDKRLEFDST